MLNEWAATRKAPQHARWMHDGSYKDLEQGMKLATLKRGGRDGTLVVVSRDLTRCQTVADIARPCRQALDDWQVDRAATGRSMKPSTTAPRATPSPSIRALCPAPCRAPTSGPMARPTSITSNWCARRAAPRCRPSSGPIR
jgi:hypothetical protein